MKYDMTVPRKKTEQLKRFIAKSGIKILVVLTLRSISLTSYLELLRIRHSIVTFCTTQGIHHKKITLILVTIVLLEVKQYSLEHQKYQTYKKQDIDNNKQDKRYL